eukprot:CAMPEP_0170155832 /NCGR_PEP_ID=MMETSP0033_2-20121228/61675_1 /TAXON_ID=195969 /ORGANISM="Dolichomastix tenuilepis, Strain CCMP3274" /LENGTH=136 /DNA_ID=CAMNT_0010393167 /DNA_START=52 /DNA_END=459 /DNA_ORIENTATION=-
MAGTLDSPLPQPHAQPQVKLFAHGESRGKPALAAAGVVVQIAGLELVLGRPIAPARSGHGVSTSQASYLALLEGIDRCVALGAVVRQGPENLHITAHIDSLLVVNHFSGAEWCKNEDLGPLLKRLRARAARIGRFE